MCLLKFKPLFRTVETGGGGRWGKGATPPQIFNKRDFLPIGNNSKKTKTAKKQTISSSSKTTGNYTFVFCPCNIIPVIYKANFD